MIVIAIVMILLAVVATALAFAGSGPAVTLSVASINLTSSPSTIFIVGGATAIVLVAGLLLLWFGLRRAHGRRREMRDLKRKAKVADSQSTPTLGTTSPTGDIGIDNGATRQVPQTHD